MYITSNITVNQYILQKYVPKYFQIFKFLDIVSKYLGYILENCTPKFFVKSTFTIYNLWDFLIIYALKTTLTFKMTVLGNGVKYIQPLVFKILKFI
jgi:hypothetical protein